MVWHKPQPASMENLRKTVQQLVLHTLGLDLVLPPKSKSTAYSYNIFHMVVLGWGCILARFGLQPTFSTAWSNP